jgi:hypothetical protein
MLDFYLKNYILISINSYERKKMNYTFAKLSFMIRMPMGMRMGMHSVP